MADNNHLRLTWPDIDNRLNEMFQVMGWRTPVYGIPRGGSIVAGLLHARGANITEEPDMAGVIVDDIVDSGHTRDLWRERYPDVPFKSLVDKRSEDLLGTWVHFPWEHSVETDMEDHIRRIIQAIGDDPSREGLLETPKRLVQSWNEIFSGYSEDPDIILKWFSSESDEMVVLKGVEFWSTCEHHMLPFFGKVSLAYIPEGHVIGISKLARLVNCMARRLTIQEDLTMHIGKAMDRHGVRGVGVSIEAQHMCMMARGVRQESAVLKTNYLSGLFQDDPATRSEFFQSIG